MSSCQQCCVLANQYRTAGARASERENAECWLAAGRALFLHQELCYMLLDQSKQTPLAFHLPRGKYSSIYIKRNPSGRRFFITHRMQTRGYFLHDLIPTPWPRAQFTAAVNFGEEASAPALGRFSLSPGCF
jgi:hypothetical protein